MVKPEPVVVEALALSTKALDGLCALIDLLEAERDVAVRGLETIRANISHHPAPYDESIRKALLDHVNETLAKLLNKEPPHA